jgi:hypothetical protein
MDQYDTDKSGELDWIEFATMFTENLAKFKVPSTPLH